jgi:hypothetical protein
MKKAALIVFITLWATFDLASLLGIMIDLSGLILVSYILKTWERFSGKEDIKIL